MRSFRFLLSRRWLLFALAVAVMAYGAWLLGEWQFSRLEERQARNALIEANRSAEPAPASDVLAPPGQGLDPENEWRVVTATGTYAPEDTVIVRYRTRDGRPGVKVVVPLVTESGTAVVVDRGWLPTDNRGTASPDDVPAPPEGEVTITGWARVDGTGESTQVDNQSVRAISSQRIGEALDRPVYGGFVELRSETPEPAQPLQPTELPELDNGPHFFYGLQWWFFGLLAVFGFGYLAYDERKRGPRSQRPRRSSRSGRPARPGDRNPESHDEPAEDGTRAGASGTPSSVGRR